MPRWSALLDVSTSAVLTLNTHIAALSCVRESMNDTSHAHGVNTPHYVRSLIHKEPFFLARAKPEEYPRWTWNNKTRVFSATNPDLLTPELLHRSHLATARCNAFSRIIRLLNTARYPLHTGVDFQEMVYVTKKLQAERFKESGYDETMMLQIPFVLQYADLVGRTLREAADEILFKAKLDEEMLSKTELLRMKFFRKLREAALEEIPTIVDDFLRESIKNTLT